MPGTQPSRSLPELKRLLALAKQLGFNDDIAHWQRQINERTQQGG